MQRTKNFVLYVLLYLISIFIFLVYFSPTFGYLYNIQNNFDILKLLLSILTIFIFCFTILPKKYEKPSDLLLHIHYIFPVNFMLVLFTLEEYNFIFLLYIVLSFIVLSLSINISFISNLGFLPKFSLKLIIKVLIFLTLILIIIIFYKFKSFLNFDISKVYKYRLVLRNVDTGLISYLVHSITPIALTILFTIGLKNKNHILIFFIFTSFILFFGLTSHKQYLFLPFAFTVIFFISKHRKAMELLIFGTIFVQVFSIILDYYITGVWARALLIDRAMYVPAKLNFIYMEFFSNNHFVWWTDSKILPFGYLIDYPYSLGVPFVIGVYHFSNPETSANTGWIGSGYAHAGLFGMIIYAFILGQILRFIDKVSIIVGKEFILSTFSIFIVSAFLSSDLKTVFLSHGLLFYLIILSLLKRRTNFESMSHYNSSSSLRYKNIL